MLEKWCDGWKAEVHNTNPESSGSHVLPEDVSVLYFSEYCQEISRVTRTRHTEARLVRELVLVRPKLRVESVSTPQKTTQDTFHQRLRTQ